MTMKTITIIGGGSLGHVCAAVLASQPDCCVKMLTGHPERWQTEIAATDPSGRRFEGRLACATASEAEALEGADWVFLCLPGFLIADTLRRIKPYLGHAAVGSIVASTGFFFFAHELLNPATPLFAFQRTPFIARVKEYGHEGLLLGYKKELFAAVEGVDDQEAFRKELAQRFLTPTTLLDSFYEVSLTNSNPILHTGRLYSLWSDYRGEALPEPLLFYKEWTDEASEFLIRMDREFMALLDRLPMKGHHIPTLLDYYESSDAASLTRKISSIPAFQTIVAPMKQTPEGWVPDFASRYFTEDFPYGLRFIKELAEQYGVRTPTIDRVYRWGIEVAKQAR